MSDPAATVLVAGECVADLRPGADGRVGACPGGSPANVAVALGRLGARVRLATALGDDEHGRLIGCWLRDAGVQVDAAPLERTATAGVRLAADGAADYAFDITVELPAVDPTESDVAWLHIGSLAAVMAPAADKVLAIAEQAHGRVPISYDPNLRPASGPVDRERVERLVALSTVVKLSEDDAALLDPRLPPEDLARGWLDRGPDLVVVTRGAAGAVAVTATDRILVGPGEGRPVVDTIGAGDAFTAGLLHGLLGTGSLTDALTLAAWVARRTCERAGADPPSLRGRVRRVLCIDGPLAGAQTSVAHGSDEVVLHDAGGEQVRYRIDGLVGVFPGELYAARQVI